MKKWKYKKSIIRGSLTVNIISKNEEEVIKRAIESIADLADEVIVVDTGSTDNTLVEAINAGARVSQVKWEDDFSKPRNKAIELSKTEWILSLDADEVIPQRGKEELSQMMAKPEIAGWRLETLNYGFQKNMLNIQVNNGVYEEGKEYPFYVGSTKTRMFQRRNDIRWRFPIHEVVDPSIIDLGGRFAEGVLKIQHLHKEKGGASLKKRADFYLSMCEKKVKQYPEMGHAWGELAVCELIKGLYPRAARSYYNAITKGEDISKNRYGYAGVLKILGHIKECDKEIDRAICMDFPNLTTIK
ncbi:hypothetical protein ES702_07585 [subsurface metagenome]